MRGIHTKTRVIQLHIRATNARRVYVASRPCPVAYMYVLHTKLGVYTHMLGSTQSTIAYTGAYTRLYQCYNYLINCIVIKIESAGGFIPAERENEKSMEQLGRNRDTGGN
ncbi:hypothetical protein PUN28_015492 [Cardiocondyla obscurior]|uniref:Uncharacterized protein n=1 Tax=Cardiocondyla obscurior TaxID=286306 RepID=A0AAW2EVW9_9HYME